ncbi:MAG: hypothetical protein JNM27_06995 [Leptospirales bacterium]|nr:hypothetical protein [Leptospirales bacterium]
MHANFKPAILLFGLFVILQFTSGVTMYSLRAGISYADTLEYYFGSEEAGRRFPGREDRFIEPKTLAGIAKSQTPHSIAFGLIFFILAHLVRSLDVNRRITRFATASFLVFAVADFLLPFLVLTGLDIFLWIRFPVMVFYSVAGSGLVILLCTKVLSSS